MSRKCLIANKKPMSGNNVSHANNKTKRVYTPNIQSVSFFSHALERRIRLRISAAAVKTIDSKGGLDAWLLQAKNSSLDKSFKKLKTLVEKKSSNA